MPMMLDDDHIVIPDRRRGVWIKINQRTGEREEAPMVRPPATRQPAPPPNGGGQQASQAPTPSSNSGATQQSSAAASARRRRAQRELRLLMQEGRREPTLEDYESSPGGRYDYFGSYEETEEFIRLSRVGQGNERAAEVALVITTHGLTLAPGASAEDYLKRRYEWYDDENDPEGDELAADVVRAAMERDDKTLSDDVGYGGGYGIGTTKNDERSDDVQYRGLSTPEDKDAAYLLNKIEEQYPDIKIAFATDTAQADITRPRLPGDEILDPAKPALRTVNGSDLEALVRLEQQLARLKESGVNITQEGDAHWTPAEIAVIDAAVSDMGQVAYNRAVALGLIKPGQITPSQAFEAIYTAENSDFTFKRSEEDKHDSGAYAWWGSGQVTLYDAAFYGEQTTTQGKLNRNPQVYFTPYLLIQHETTHQLNAMYQVADDYGNSFVYQEGKGFEYTFQKTHQIKYMDGDKPTLGIIRKDDTIHLPTNDSGYNFRARSVAVPPVEEVTDALVAITVGSGAYTDSGIRSKEEELYGLARKEAAQMIYDDILNRIDWDNIGD